ncbi:hypothetical protein H1R20_g11371, partial [Candolleomyces eurysporus]
MPTPNSNEAILCSKLRWSCDANDEKLKSRRYFVMTKAMMPANATLADSRPLQNMASTRQ